MEVTSVTERLQRRGSVSLLSAWDLLDLRGLQEEMVFQGEMETQALLVSRVSEELLARQERMVALDCLEQTERTVFLELKVHQEKMGSMEILDLQVPLDFLDLRVLRELLGLEDGLETRGLMDL